MNKFKGLIFHQMQPLDEIFMPPEEWELLQCIERWAATEQGQATMNMLYEISSCGVSAADVAEAFIGLFRQGNDGDVDGRS